MNFVETVDFLYSQLPVFQKQGGTALKPKLDNIRALCSLLNNPQDCLKTIHIAGTNGKGSVSHMLSAALQAQGLKVGLYTSPHLKSMTERFKINGREIPEEFIVRFVEDYFDQFKSIEPSFFEWTVALAFYYFEQEDVDIAVIEVGLGGRLDSTNIISPLCSVITNIGFDHQAFLGDTLEKIAGEKAGIVKPNTPVVVGEYHEKTWPVFEKSAQKNHAKIRKAWEVPFPEKIAEKLAGYPLKNAKTAWATLNTVFPSSQFQEEWVKGILQYQELTQFKGRWQVLSTEPKIIADVAHNEEGLREVLHLLGRESYRKLHLVYGAANDKKVAKILAFFPSDAFFYFCEAKLPRAMPAAAIAAQAELLHLNYKELLDVNDAIAEARKSAEHNDLIMVTGSNFIIGEIKDL